MPRHESISEVLRRLDRGGSVTFDSGHQHGSITVTRSSLRAGPPWPSWRSELPLVGADAAFVVSGVTSSRAGLTADEAQVDVGRRRRIRDQAKGQRDERARSRGFGS